MKIRFGALTILVGTLVGCVGPAPIEDYTLASTALNAARSSKASRFAPGFLGQAEEFYRQAQLDYEDRRYDEARENFVRARQFAEKAENYTVLKKAETGESE
jgi:hypothetical protein